MRQKLIFGLMAVAALLLARNLYVMLLQFPDEAHQGPIYRIIFFHVPAAWTAFLCFFGAMIASVLYLATKNLRYDAFAASVTEVGLAFGAANLVTGMIWGRIIWGIWWTWDARLTSMLVCWLLYAGLPDAAAGDRRADPARQDVRGAFDLRVRRRAHHLLLDQVVAHAASAAGAVGRRLDGSGVLVDDVRELGAAADAGHRRCC